MNKTLLAAAGVVLLLVATLVASVAVRFLSTEIPDVCTAEYDRCADTGTGIVGAIDCRIEVYHCRAFGEFTHPDGTVVRVPTDDER